MIRAALIGLMIVGASPSMSQDLPALPDVTQIRNDPKFDMSWVPPLALQQAIAAAEDPGWFDSFPATSTITQQVAKNYLLSGLNTLTRKTMEIRLAIDIANAYTPDEILSIYTQGIYTGRRCFGIAASVQHLLGTPIEDASLRDFITLASVIKAPSFYDSDPEWLLQRFAYTVRNGRAAGFWTDTQADALLLAGPTPIIDGARCPYAP